eukprot:12082793-Karenia_brevis.AAC.1
MMGRMRDMMREVVREELGKGLGEVRGELKDLRKEMDITRQQSEKASSTASAAMEAVRALRQEINTGGIRGTHSGSSQAEQAGTGEKGGRSHQKGGRDKEMA